MSPTTRAVLAASFVLTSTALAAVEVKEEPGRVRVAIDGQLFTEYVFAGAPHVYYWPVLGPGGVRMTRSWPMENVPGEEHDHPHHRSLWFSHGLVNGVDFWTEAPAASGDKAPKHPVGKIVHDKIVEAKGGAESGVITTSQKWVADDGSVPVTSVQTLHVHQRPANERLFDFAVTLTAGEKEVVFGDTKEGTFAIRVAESMRLKAPKGAPAGMGHIVNSEGIRDDKVWGQAAKWVDMYGPIGGKTYGIAIFDHPKNPRHPTRWHARDYGLFAANPFCGREMDKSLPEDSANFELKAGQSFTLSYRVLIHEGDADPAVLDTRFREFAAQAR